MALELDSSLETGGCHKSSSVHLHQPADSLIYRASYPDLYETIR